MKATARAMPNIAFIKYWGNADNELRIPINPSISMNLDGLFTTTTVNWDESLNADTLTLNGQNSTDAALERVSIHLSLIRERLNMSHFAHVESTNNFPMGAGIASSASAFAALTMAAVDATGETLSEAELSTIARRGSGSASRSIPSGFVVWHQGDSHESSYAESIASPSHWNLVDVIAVVDEGHKKTGSQAGHKTAPSSDLQNARVKGAQARFDTCKQAIFDKDFDTFAEVVEYDSNLMHAVMMTSRPALFYWKPATLTIMEEVRNWRSNGINVCYTLDAGPNVHCICLAEHADTIKANLATIDGVKDILTARPGGATTIL